jgi:arylformamidase
MSSTWIDISVPLCDGMVTWPGDTPVEIRRTMEKDKGDPVTMSDLRMSAHTGTHMDAPLHYLAGAASLDELPLDAVVGPARVIRIEDPHAVGVDELRGQDFQPGERVLFQTRNSERCWRSETFVEDFVYISAAAASYLVERRVQTVGIDYLSVGGYVHDQEETHHVLLGAGIWIIEGLDLSGVEPGDYELICLPLKLAGGDGAPARAVLRRL